MNYKYYEKKINDILYKCNLESGTEILTYMLLDKIIENNNLSLIAIDKLQKKNRFLSKGGFSDLAVVSNDFLYDDPNKGICYGCVEVKRIRRELKNVRGQVIGQLLTFNNVLVTNGLDWEFYSLNVIRNNCKDDDALEKIEEEIEKAKKLVNGYSNCKNQIHKIIKNSKEYETNQNYIDLKKQLNIINDSLDKSVIKPIWSISLSTKRRIPFVINNTEFVKLINKLNQIRWN